MNNKCPSCGAEVSAEEKYCTECGSPMNQLQNIKNVCPFCNAVLSNGEKFCPECGKPTIQESETNTTCASCGAKISSEEKFCPECGSLLNSSPQSVSAAPSQPIQEKSNIEKKGGRSYLLYGVVALVIIGAIGFGITMFTGANKQQVPVKETQVVTQTGENLKNPVQEKPKTRNEQAASILHSLGITGEVKGTTYGANPDGFYALVGKESFLVDLKNKQAAHIEDTHIFKELVDARYARSDTVLYPKFLIINDKQDKDKNLGAWQNNSHYIPVYAPVEFDASGNIKVGRLFSGSGVSPSHFHDVLKEQKNIDLVKLFFKETFPYLDTVAGVMPQETAKTSAPDITKSGIAAANHSSALKEENYLYAAALTIDGDINTCWAEGVPGLGFGESITYYFNGNYKVSGMSIWTGHQKSEDLFYKNARPIALRVIGSDGSNIVYRLNDTMGIQRISFKTPVIINSIKLVVEKVAPGNKYEDTCIAEVSFF